MVALCSGDFKVYADNSSIMPRQLVIELHALQYFKMTPRFLENLFTPGLHRIWTEYVARMEKPEVSCIICLIPLGNWDNAAWTFGNCLAWI